MDQRLTRLPAARVLVVGDVILDRYWYGATRRISPEAPVPVVSIDAVEERVGGAANVAANAAALDASTALIGVIGDDDEGRRLAELCAARGIGAELLRCPERRTIVKLRVVSQHQQLLRIDFERDAAVGHGSTLVDAVRSRLAACDVVVLSDYAKGTLHDVSGIIGAARAAGKPVVVDPKGADFARYGGAALLTPNLHEFEAVVGRCVDDADLVARARALCRQCEIDAVLVTRGDAGMSLVDASRAVHLAADARDVYDVTGAGDTVCAVTAVALAAGLDLAVAIALANTAAGLVVGKFGAASVTRAELDAALLDQAGVRRGVLTPAELLAARQQARRRGETVVMTNGCFDLLHEGHVRFLAQARALGDRLIVAVNDDDSVTALKGAGRPLNTLASRMHVLAALTGVDWVVPFAGATPAALIADVLPDVLVKGGDYTVDAIAGAAAVMAAGGRVQVLDYHAGHSTTALAVRLGAGAGQAP